MLKADTHALRVVRPPSTPPCKSFLKCGARPAAAAHNGGVAEGRRLTRRDVLSGAAAGAGALFGPAAARAADGRGAGAPARPTTPHEHAPSHGDLARLGGRVFARGVGALGAGEARTVALSRPVCLAAVRWSGQADAGLALRARRPDGRWGPWANASAAGHDGDGVRARERVGEGVWLGRADVLQVRSRGRVRDAALLLVSAEPDPAARANAAAGARAQGADGASGAGADAAPGTGADGTSGAGADALPLAGPALPAGPGQPPIIARAVWAGADHRPVGGPYYGQIELGIVHHTENPNAYSPGDVPAMLRAIYEFHVHGRGWFDIGYNFVIDRFGRIWEARQGGIALPVIGAQAGDWNQISFGVSLLGTYTAVRPSAAAMSALERLLAWKLALSGLPAVGEISAVASAADISYTQFRAGQHVRFPRIAGHRQVDSTDCPGDALFGELPALRRRVQAMLGPETRLTLQGEITLFPYGPVLFMNGRLTERGAPLAGVPVALQRIVHRGAATETVTTLTTAADGTFQSSLPARAGLRVYALRTDAPAAVSEVLEIESLAEATAGADALRLARPPWR